MEIIDTFKHIWWDAGALYLLDQRLLPNQEVIIRCGTVEEVERAIKTMQVRGAPAIGCTAAYGMAIVAAESAGPEASEQSLQSTLDRLQKAQQFLDASRPTAVNLAWATARMINAIKAFIEQQKTQGALPSTQAIADFALQEAHAIMAEDLAMCHAMGKHGADLIPAGGRVLTHCNAGGLATAGYGTALAPIRTAHEQGRSIHVFVDETRPFLQGARLTAWELNRAQVPLTLITDNMAGYFMRRGDVDCVIVGADRIVANGDVANKIGTYSVAVLAKAHNIPFYVAAPSSTIDMSLATGDEIPIEQRDSGEVTNIAGHSIAPEGVTAAHPAFDVTPNHLVTAIITERGVVYPPFSESLRRILEQPE